MPEQSRSPQGGSRFEPTVPMDVQADLEWLTRAENGARTLFRLLAGRVGDEELAAVLSAFQREQDLQIDTLRRLLERVGMRARSSLLPRELLARVVHAGTLFGARSLALRTCLESQVTLQHRYSCLAGWFQASERRDLARVCDELSVTKARQVSALQAWVRQ